MLLFASRLVPRGTWGSFWFGNMAIVAFGPAYSITLLHCERASCILRDRLLV